MSTSAAVLDHTCIASTTLRRSGGSMVKPPLLGRRRARFLFYCWNLGRLCGRLGRLFGSPFLFAPALVVVRRAHVTTPPPLALLRASVDAAPPPVGDRGGIVPFPWAPAAAAAAAPAANITAGQAANAQVVIGLQAANGVGPTCLFPTSFDEVTLAHAAAPQSPALLLTS